jgi:hypothetical protein
MNDPSTLFVEPNIAIDLDSRRDFLQAGREGGLMQNDYTAHQQKIIKRYYDNQDTIQKQRLAELVSELFLSEGKKRANVWKRVLTALEKLGIPQSRIDHIRTKDDPALVAEIVKELEGKK